MPKGIPNNYTCSDEKPPKTENSFGALWSCRCRFYYASSLPDKVKFLISWNWFVLKKVSQNQNLGGGGGGSSPSFPRHMGALDLWQEFKIKSRKITHMVTRRDAFLELSLQPITDFFRCTVQGKKQKLPSQLNPEYRLELLYIWIHLLNSWVSRVKDVAVAVKIKRKTNHSYTLEKSISSTGKLVGPEFLITQARGEFCPFVRKMLEEMHYGIVIIVCSMSGKSTK